MKITKEQYAHFLNYNFITFQDFLFNYSLERAMDGSPMVYRRIKKWALIVFYPLFFLERLLDRDYGLREFEWPDRYYHFYQRTLHQWNCKHWEEAEKMLKERG